MRRPEFIVVAGPNGAGKSTLCSYYIQCTSFDGDLLATKLRLEHPDWPDRWIIGSVATMLEKQKSQSISNRENFAFETNFSTELILNMIEEFKKSDYKISLYYFGIDTLDDSMYRVEQRVVCGGHNVPEEIVKFNFYESIKNVNKYLNLFDSITFIDGYSKYGDVIALYIKKSEKLEITKTDCNWFNDYFKESFEKLKMKATEQKVSKRPRFKL